MWVSFFFVEVFQLTNAEGIRELENDHLVTPNEIIHLGNAPHWLLKQDQWGNLQWLDQADNI